MTMLRVSMGEHAAGLSRWVLCFFVVVCAHAAGVAALTARWDHSAEPLASGPAITIDLAPAAAAPEIVPTDIAVGPQQVESARETPPPPPPPQDVSVEPPKPPEKPVEKKKVAKLTTAPAPAPRRAPVAVAPAPGADARDSNALPNWRSLLIATLERNKRYPSDARSRGDQGVTQLAFTVDRNGNVSNARIARSSGYSSLDSETLAMIQRASPLPPPPAEIGARVSIVVPIRYNIR